MSRIYLLLRERLKKRTPLALATMLNVRGSVPQVAGASALFSRRGLVAGTLGGGPLEADVQKSVAGAMAKKAPVILGFNLKGKAIEDEEALCGGEAQILIDPCPSAHRAVFDGMAASLAGGRPGVLVTVVSGAAGPGPSLRRFWASAGDGGDGCALSPRSGYPGAGREAGFPADKGFAVLCREGIRKALSERRPGFRRFPGSRRRDGGGDMLLFFDPVFPPPRLVIAGAGHIGQAVCHLGHILDFEVTVIDDRPEFADRRRLPEAAGIIRDDFRRALRSLPLTPDTYLVIVTRGHRHDAGVLRASIRSNAAYIGMIGSRIKVERMKKEFLDKGWATPAEWSRVHAPIGVDIQSKTVAEIAVSIAAELVLVRRGLLAEKGGRG
ncbi:MAG: XdhC/CoxI family protein [Acidobacteriota bacterium]|nr:XdhC/CoxI family protein [Acidobacteriota bacterium]